MNAMRRLVPLVLGIVVMACSDDATGPRKFELAIIANSFESLGRSRDGARCAGSSFRDSYSPHP